MDKLQSSVAQNTAAPITKNKINTLKHRMINQISCSILLYSLSCDRKYVAFNTDTSKHSSVHKTAISILPSGHKKNGHHAQNF